MDEDNGFEKIPNVKTEISGEQAQRAEKWETAMQDNVPEFRGDKFGVANSENRYYGETVADEAETDEAQNGEEYDEGIADAAELINYGLNAATRDLGVENVVQKIKSFDAGGREEPIKDLFVYLGVDSPEEEGEIQKEGEAAAVSELAFRDGVNAPSKRSSAEGAQQALADMKELIAEVEGADPRYEALRAGAKAAGMGYFEYAVDGFNVRGLPELFQVLAEQREQFDEGAANGGATGGAAMQASERSEGLGNGGNLSNLNSGMNGLDGLGDSLGSNDNLGLGNSGANDDMGGLANNMNGAEMNGDLDERIVSGDGGNEETEREVIESALRNGMSEKELAEYLKDVENLSSENLEKSE